MAEGILKELAAKYQLNWHIESAATESYHIGKPPDSRAIRTCKKYGIDISNQRARKLSHADFGNFDIVYALAEEVMVEINQSHSTKAIQSELKLLLDEGLPTKQAAKLASAITGAAKNALYERALALKEA